MTKRLKVLFLCSWYPSRVFKAHGDFIQRHAEAVSLLHDITSFHIVTDPSLVNETIQYDYSTIRGVSTKIAYVKPSKNPFTKGYRFYKAFRRMLNSEEQFDFVHLNTLFPFGIYALYLKIFHRIPYLITEHWTAFHKEKKSFSIKSLFLMKMIVRFSSFVCPVSDDLANSMTNLGLKGKYRRVPNVVDTKMFSVGVEQENEKQLIVLHVSSMDDEHKNISGILRAISNIDRPYHCYFVGGESPVPVDDSNVTFIPHVDQEELVHYFHKADVFLLFSNKENLPCVILESFSCGVPVISTDVGGISEYFPEDFGVLIPPKDEKALTDVLQSWEHKDLDKVKMHQYVITHFSKKSIAESFNEYYQKMLI